MTVLLARLPKKQKRDTRWRSQAHCNHVRRHACIRCGATAPIEVAHVRIGSGAGMGQKPDDFRTVALCQSCHAAQHRGEASFWQGMKEMTGDDAEAYIAAFIDSSPKKQQIRQVMREREGG